MGDFRDFYLDNDKCPECGTAATYKLPDGGFACKCTFEAETNLHERTNNPVNGDAQIPNLAKSARTHKIRGCFLEIPEAWYGTALKIDTMLGLIDPDYQLLQVKDKFGQLRYYFHTEKHDAQKVMHAIENWGAEEVEKICVTCGGEATTERNYFRVCEAHKNND